MIFWPWMAGLRQLAAGVELLMAFSAAASIFCMFVAIALREPFAAGGLNHWDEALTYVALARLLHLIHGLPR